MRTLRGIVLLVALGTVACSSDSTATGPSLAGSYYASVFLVKQTGIAVQDVLAAGGSMTLAIGSTGTTTGALAIPASITGGAALSASMAGTASLTGTSVTLTQSADTFVRDLTWTLSTTGLAVSVQTVAGTIYTITLTRQ